MSRYRLAPTAERGGGFDRALSARPACNADRNAARNIAAGRAVTARGDLGASRSVNREPQLCSPAAQVVGGVGIPRHSQGGTSIPPTLSTGAFQARKLR